MNSGNDASTGRDGTFARFPFGKLSDLDAGMLAIFGVSMNATYGREHAAVAGPQALRQCSVDYLSDFLQSPSRTVVDIDTGKTLRLRDGFAGIDVGNLDAGGIADADMANQIASLAQSVAAARAIPVLLGGNVNCLLGLIEGFWAARRKPALLLLTNRLFMAGGSRNFIRASDNQTEASNRLAELETCQVGINGLQSAGAWARIHQANGAKIVTADTIHDGGWSSAVEQVGTFIDTQDEVICAIDAAVLDTGYAAGTADLNVGGLTPQQLVSMSTALDVTGKLAGMALLNIAPEFDARGHTEQAVTDSAFALLDGLMVEEIRS